MYNARDLSTDTNLKRKDLVMDFTAATVNIKVPQLVIKIILHLFACQIKALAVSSE
jgi:hypothetical protein